MREGKLNSEIKAKQPLPKDPGGYVIAPLYDARPKTEDIKEIRKAEIIKNLNEYLEELRFNKLYNSNELRILFETNYINELKEVLAAELPKRGIKIIESEDERFLTFVHQRNEVGSTIEPNQVTTETIVTPSLPKSRVAHLEVKKVKKILSKK